MLPQKSRVNKRLFQEIMKKGLLAHGKFFVFRYLSVDVRRLQKTSDVYTTDVHLACVAPKSIAQKAVMRNKMRRRVYSVLRTTPIKKGCGIFFYKKSGATASLSDLREDIVVLLKKANFI